MQDPYFSEPLSRQEISKCVEDALALAIDLFGPVQPNSFRCSTDRLTASGSYAQFSRLVTAREAVIEAITLEGTVFVPEGDSQEALDEDEETIKYWEGTVVDVSLDSCDCSFTARRWLGTLTVGALGDVEIDRSEPLDEITKEEYDGEEDETDGPWPTLNDEFVLSEVRFTLLP